MDFLNNTEIVVAIGFVIFVGVLIYFGVPGMITRMLDARAVRIKQELDEARALRDEAQTLLAGYERRQKEVRAQAEDIVTAARAEAEKAAETAKEDIRNSVARRLKTALPNCPPCELGRVSVKWQCMPSRSLSQAHMEGWSWLRPPNSTS